MCGIAAVLESRSTEADDRMAAPLIRALRHRGPDRQAPAALSLPVGRTLTLVHRRPTILDLAEAGGQPMTDPETGNVIVSNGEIHNFAALLGRLERDRDPKQARRLWALLALGRHFDRSGLAPPA